MDTITKFLLETKSVKERKQTLRNIVYNLDQDEVDFLRECVTELPLKKDIIAALPVELLLEVLKYLGMLEPWRLQCVSKQWQQVMSAEDVVRSALARWYSSDDLQLPGEDKMIFPQWTRAKIRHMQAFRLGAPFTYAGYREPMDVAIGERASGSTLALHALCGEYLAYTTDDGHAVKILNLRTGDTSAYRGEARERVNGIILTRYCVGFVTSDGILYVTMWREPEAKLEHFRLPSANVIAMAGDDHSLAVLVGNVASGFEIAICDVAKGSIKAFRINHDAELIHGAHCVRGYQAMMFAQTSKDLIAFFVPQDPVAGGHLGYNTYSLSGVLLKTKMLNLRNYGLHVLYRNLYISEVHPTDHQRTLNILLRCNYGSKQPLDHVVSLDLVHGTAILTGNRPAGSRQAWTPTLDYYPYMRDLYRWKDTVYGYGFPEELYSEYFTLRQEGIHLGWMRSRTELSASMQTSISSATDHDPALVARNDNHLRLLGNENFLVVMFGNGFVVWCFDEGKLAKGQSTHHWRDGDPEDAENGWSYPYHRLPYVGMRTDNKGDLEPSEEGS